jgi:hypothetical protein
MAHSVFNDLVYDGEVYKIITSRNIKFKCDCPNCDCTPSDYLFLSDTIRGLTKCRDEQMQRKNNMNGHTTLMYAALHGYNVQFEQELKKSSSYVQLCDDNGSNAITYAIGQSTSVKFIEDLLKVGVEPNVPNLWGLDGFLTAVLVNDLDSFIFLISERQVMFTNFVYSDGDTVLHKACRHKNSDFAKLLCEHITDEIICTPNRYGKLAIDVWGDITYKTSIVEIAGEFRSFSASTDETKAEIDEAKVEVDEAKEDLLAHLEAMFAELK